MQMRRPGTSPKARNRASSGTNLRLVQQEARKRQKGSPDQHHVRLYPLTETDQGRTRASRAAGDECLGTIAPLFWKAQALSAMQGQRKIAARICWACAR